jgi:DNA-binding response OmpR family regulator
MTKIRPPTILCVDDEPAALTLRKCLLENAGYRVVPAEDAASAFLLFKSQPIDLVISDHLLPDLKGADMTREMKHLRPFVPVMLFSGVADTPGGTEHADVFISKTEGPAELLKKVADLLRCNRITEGNYFAEIRCDSRFEQIVWHYTIQRVRSNEILGWSQAFSEKDAREASRAEMRELNQRSESEGH